MWAFLPVIADRVFLLFYVRTFVSAIPNLPNLCFSPARIMLRSITRRDCLTWKQALYSVHTTQSWKDWKNLSKRWNQAHVLPSSAVAQSSSKPSRKIAATKRCFPWVHAAKFDEKETVGWKEVIIKNKCLLFFNSFRAICSNSKTHSHVLQVVKMRDGLCKNSIRLKSIWFQLVARVY